MTMSQPPRLFEHLVTAALERMTRDGRGLIPELAALFPTRKAVPTNSGSLGSVICAIEFVVNTK